MAVALVFWWSEGAIFKHKECRASLRHPEVRAKRASKEAAFINGGQQAP